MTRSTISTLTVAFFLGFSTLAFAQGVELKDPAEVLGGNPPVVNTDKAADKAAADKAASDKAAAEAREAAAEKAEAEAKNKAATTPSPITPGGVKGNGPATAGVDKCPGQAVQVPALTKPANYWLTVMDVDGGLLQAMKGCNEPTQVAEFPGAKTERTVILHVTQGTDHFAHFYVPSERYCSLKFSYTILDEQGNKLSDWVSDPGCNQPKVVMRAAKPDELKLFKTAKK